MALCISNIGIKVIAELLPGLTAGIGIPAIRKDGIGDRQESCNYVLAVACQSLIRIEHSIVGDHSIILGKLGKITDAIAAGNMENLILGVEDLCGFMRIQERQGITRRPSINQRLQGGLEIANPIGWKIRVIALDRENVDLWRHGTAGLISCQGYLGILGVGTYSDKLLGYCGAGVVESHQFVKIEG